MSGLGHVLAFGAGLLCLFAVMAFALLGLIAHRAERHLSGDCGEGFICNLFCALGLCGAIYFFFFVA